MAVANATSAQLMTARARITEALHALTVVSQYGKPRSAEAGTNANTLVANAITALQAVAAA